MIRSVLGRALLVAIGAAAAGLVIRWRAGTEPVPSEPVATQLAARKSGADETAGALAAGSPPAAPEAPAQADANAPAAGGNAGSAMERALAAAGLDPATVADIKRRDDESAMAEINLRNRATREQWLDSPRFNAEMAAIEAQRTPLRDEIGDDAYDRYLFALGETNRVRVDDVLEQSPAAQAGLQTGDLIVRYGDARLFNPSELVNQTRSGTEGEAVQLEIIRDGQRLEVQVPRGPLGLRVAATQGNPETS
jgi:membrane-associated protease RseP (regulator of RpoE activity)